MNEMKKDKGLTKALSEQPVFRLPSNFTYRTMQKVEEAVLLREKKQDRRTLLATIAASVFLIAGTATGLYLYWGTQITAAISKVFQTGVEALDQPIPFIYLLFCLTLPVFAVLDRWMRKQYFKHHSL